MSRSDPWLGPCTEVVLRVQGRPVPNNTPDVTVHNEGTLFLFRPLTDKAKAWIAAHVQPEALWFGDALVVEHRYAADLAQGMRDDGLRLA